MPRPTTTPRWLLCCAICLAGCASPPPRSEVVRVAPPAPLLSCQEEPAVPEVATQRDVARYIVALRHAGQDCRNKLAELRDWSSDALGDPDP